MESGNRELLVQRLDKEGFEIVFDPHGDGMCFYASVGHHLGLSAITVRNIIFDYLLNHRYDVDGSDKLDFICDIDLSCDEVPTSWDNALRILKQSFANELVLRTFPDIFNYTMIVITVYGSGRENYTQVFQPKGHSDGTLYIGHSGDHYMALKQRARTETPTSPCVFVKEQSSDSDVTLLSSPPRKREKSIKRKSKRAEVMEWWDQKEEDCQPGISVS